MNKILKYILSVLLVACPVLLFGQKQLVKSALKSSKKLFKVETKNLTKEGVETANKAMMENAFKTGAEEIGKNYMQKATAKQIIRRTFREKLLKEIEEKELGSILRYGMTNARKEIAQTEKSVVKKVLSKGTHDKAYKQNVQKVSKEIASAEKNAGKTVIEKESKNNMSHLLARYCGKGGFKKFMSMSIKDRMVTIKQLTKHIYSLPEAERNKALKSMSTEMREKVVKMRKLMTTGMPPKPSPKGSWTGERGNSDFILNDDYMWTNPKTGIKISVRDLKKQYKIKGELKVRYRDGEPIFDKSNSLGTTKVEYKQNYDYKNIKDLHNPVNENLSKEPWVKSHVNDKAVDPTRDYVENAAVDGSRVTGARNTYHEAMDGETIYVVPDFIHRICTHNGGRSVAALVQ